ncbi:MAG TPA: hypothetical protein VMO00_13075 [Methylomirabilota bacterium]|nr:hypothetical protein [Methylomirabilota bacterium]
MTIELLTQLGPNRIKQLPIDNRRLLAGQDVSLEGHFTSPT